MFSKIFGECRGRSQISPANKLKQALEMLEEKELVLQRKISLEVDRAKEFTRAKNKPAALECLKRKKYYEGKMEQVGNFQLRIRNQEQKATKNYQLDVEREAWQIPSNMKSSLEKN